MKLSKEQKIELCQLVAEGNTVAQVTTHFRETHRIILSHSAVFYYRKHHRWKKKIHELREKWEKELTEEMLASKRSRLRLLEKAYDQAMRWHVAKCDKKGRTIKKCNPGAAIAALRAAREEMEGTKVTTGGDESVLNLLKSVFAEIAAEGWTLPRFRPRLEDELRESGLEVEQPLPDHRQEGE